MASKSTDWRPGATVCRCCFAEGCYKDISSEYFWMGKREVYAEMLSETFDISISYSQATGPNSNSRLICEPCISRLRDASDFKRQVLECEKTFIQYLDPGRVTVEEVEAAPLAVEKEEVKLECVKVEEVPSEGEFDDHAFADDDDDLDDEPLTKLASKIPKKETIDETLIALEPKPEKNLKRKSISKTKSSPAKKAKKKETSKATPSKSSKPATEKKKKGTKMHRENELAIELPPEEVISKAAATEKKKYYQKSARAEARRNTKINASVIIECWTVCPFRWTRNKFKCAYCEENFTDCSLLREHVRTCSLSHSTLEIFDKFKEMNLINVDIRGATCRVCSIPLTEVNQLREHAISHNNAFNTGYPDGVIPFNLDKESWRCIICLKEFNNYLKLYTHMNVHYQHYICAVCGKGFMTGQRLRKHSEFHLSGSYSCRVCGEMFQMKSARDSHRARVHAKQSRYECPQCDMRFTGYYDRLNHLNVTHKEKEVLYNCSYCGLLFKTSHARAKHVRTLHYPREKKVSCNLCEWRFRSAYELKNHMVKHTKERNYHCRVCFKSFARMRALKLHMKTHESLKQREMFANLTLNVHSLSEELNKM